MWGAVWNQSAGQTAGLAAASRQCGSSFIFSRCYYWAAGVEGVLPSWSVVALGITANCFSFSWGERLILPCRGGVGLWLRCCGNWRMWIRNYRPRHECHYCSYLCLVFSCNVGRGVLKKTCSWSQVTFQSLMIWSKLSVLHKVVRFP